MCGVLARVARVSHSHPAAPTHPHRCPPRPPHPTSPRPTSHRRPRGLPGSNPNLRLEVGLAVHADSTMAVEVALSQALLNWPYFQDLSLVGACLGGAARARVSRAPQCVEPLVGPHLKDLSLMGVWSHVQRCTAFRVERRSSQPPPIREQSCFLAGRGPPRSWARRLPSAPFRDAQHQVWSITNIFSAPGSPARPRGERDDLIQPPRPPPAPVLATGPSAWFYFNLLITQSQVGPGWGWRGWAGAEPRWVLGAGCWVRGRSWGLGLAGAAAPPSSHARPAITRTPQPPSNRQIFVPIYDVLGALAEARKLGARVDGAGGAAGEPPEPPSGFHAVADMALGLELGPLIDLLDAEDQGGLPPACFPGRGLLPAGRRLPAAGGGWLPCRRPAVRPAVPARTRPSLRLLAAPASTPALPRTAPTPHNRRSPSGLAPPAEEQLALEERGLALSATALRFGYAYGGDGESNIKVGGQRVGHGMGGRRRAAACSARGLGTHGAQIAPARQQPPLRSPRRHRRPRPRRRRWTCGTPPPLCATRARASTARCCPSA